jgi:predicted phosphohydrolase
MKFAFDLISDLHIESWPEFDWTGQPTSQFCVVAGDVARDPTLVRETLEHLGQCYRGVFYIDGNDEHRHNFDDLSTSYRDLVELTTDIENVVYLQDNLVVINGVAILGTNGWWTYDLDPTIDYEQTQTWMREYIHCLPDTPDVVANLAINDTRYIASSIKKLQTHQDVRKIVVVTHTVPGIEFVQHDLDLQGTYRLNTVGNSLIRYSLGEDLEKKVSHWVFGHYHGSVDRVVDGVRFVNNCRGRGDTPWHQAAYHPLRIEIEV